MCRNTITYRFALAAGIFTGTAALLSFLEIFSHNETWAYGVLLPMELLILPASGMCGIVLLALDLIFKKQLPSARFNNKFLIAIEWILIAGYAFVSGYMIFEIMRSYLNNPAEALGIFGIYFSAGAIAAAIIWFATLKFFKIK